MKPIINVQDLSKDFKVHHNHKGYLGAFRNLFDHSYDLVHAVDKVTFDVKPGELVGYIGPNGAGKSTTLKMLAGLLVPTSGSLEVNGYLPWKQRKDYVREIGVVFGQRTTLWWDLPLTDSIELLQRIYEIPEDVFQANFKHFREILELDPFLNTPVRSLSLGQRMRADLCAAFLHNPSLVFLDEPTIGLDVVAKQRIRDFIQYINQEKGTTILLTTHDISDVQKLCERVLIIDHGKILFDGKLAKLLADFGGKRFLSVEFAEHYPDIHLQDADVVKIDGNQVVFSFERKAISASKLINRLSANYRISDLEVQNQPIEDTIRQIYEGQLLYNHPYDTEDPAS